MRKKIITLGISGHRDLREEDLERVRIELLNRIKEIKGSYPGYRIKMVCGTAPGTDQLAMGVVDELSDPTIKWDNLDKKVEQKKTDDIVGLVFYHSQATYLVKNCDVIIVVWDGIFTHKPGGTSEVVRMALESGRPIRIDHLICPRESNLFPVNSLGRSAIDHQTKKFIRIPYTLSFTWNSIYTAGHHRRRWWLQLGKLRDLWVLLVKVFRRQLFWYFITPIFLSICTLILGTVGYGRIFRGDFGNNFFRSVSLITLNGSVFDDTNNPGLLLEMARITGLLTVIFAFLYALLLALKDFREHFIRLVWRYRGFDLVVGLSEKSLMLIRSLSRTDRRIVVLAEVEDSVYDNELRMTPKLILVKGSLSSSTMLKNVYAMHAAHVFVMSDSDTMNVRAAQELATIGIHPSGHHKRPNIYIHLLKPDYAKFLRNNLGSGKTNAFIFNIYENSVRRLFLHYPPDRNYQSIGKNTILAVIIGFDEMGQHILQTLLKQGHYTSGVNLKIIVYDEHAEQSKDIFEKKYPLALKSGVDRKSDGTRPSDIIQMEQILDDVWHNIKLDFVPLPASDKEWLDEEQEMYIYIDEGTIVNIYGGLADGIESASYFHTILPKLNQIQNEKKCNIQVFCYYNFPDKKEEHRIEQYLDKLAPEIFVRCFGNYLDECDAEAIRNMTLDEMAKLIHAFYTPSDSFREIINKDLPVKDWPAPDEYDVHQKWILATPKDRLSSQQAGDHLWVKLRNTNRMECRSTAIDSDATNDRLLLSKEEILTLAQIEHKRWSAEMLLQGFVPFEISTADILYGQYVKLWNINSNMDELRKVFENPDIKDPLEAMSFKKNSLSIKRHINLVPFDQLKDSESEKDFTQIKAIPYFLKHILISHET